MIVNDCANRSFIAGLRWAGITRNHLPDLSELDTLIDVAGKYGLRCVTNGYTKTGNSPVLVVYQDNKVATSSIYHAVFCSDAAPFSREGLLDSVVIYGWDELRKQRMSIKGKLGLLLRGLG